MTVKTFIYTSYYVVIVGILTTQIAYTIYQTSLVVGNGQRLGKLQQEQQLLAARQQQLQTQSAQRLSLSTITNDQLTEYQLINKPIIIPAASSLAAVQ